MTIPVQVNTYAASVGTAPNNVPHVDTRAPATTDVNYPVGQVWVNKTASTAYMLGSFSASNGVITANWIFLESAAGALSTLTGDSGGAITAVAGNINILGTAGQITTTGSAGAITISLPAALVAPGTLEVVGLLTGDASATINTAGVALNLGTDNSGDAVNIGTGTVARAIHIGDSAAAHVLTLGSNTAGSGTTIKVGTGNFALTPAITSTITFGGATNTGIMTLGNSTSGQVLNISSAINTGAQIVNISTGAAGADSTVNILSGNATAGTQTFNLFTGTNAGAINIGTGTTGVKTIAIGGTAANVITIGNTQTTGSLAFGNALTSGTITFGGTSGTGLITIGQATNATGQTISISSATSNTGANIVNLLNGTTPGASTTLNIMCGAGSAGTQAINILSTGATRAGTFSIGNGAAAHVGVIGSTNGAASTTIQAGTGGLILTPTAGNASIAPVTGSAASANITLNGRLFQSTHTGLTTAAAASQVFVITNSAVTGTTQAIQLSCDNLGANDAQMTITRVLQANGSLTVTLKNNGAAALNGDVHITGWILN